VSEDFEKIDPILQDLYKDDFFFYIILEEVFAVLLYKETTS
jgi:hypothetical protein